MADKIFPEGFKFWTPREGAPDFVKGSLVIFINEAIEWLKQQKGAQVRLDLKVSQGGKSYAEVNTYQKDAPKDEPKGDVDYGTADTINPDDIPF